MERLSYMSFLIFFTVFSQGIAASSDENNESPSVPRSRHKRSIDPPAIPPEPHPFLNLYPTYVAAPTKVKIFDFDHFLGDGYAINPRVVVTFAHFFHHRRLDRLKVLPYEPHENIYHVEDMIINQRLIEHDWHHNVAVLEVGDSIPMGETVPDILSQLFPLEDVTFALNTAEGFLRARFYCHPHPHV